MGIRIPQHTAADKENSSSFNDLMNKDIKLFGSSLSNKYKEEFYAELSVLLTSGIALTQALELIAEGQKKQSHKQLFQSMGQGIIAGKSLHEIFEQDTVNFTAYETHAIKIGKDTGKLNQIAEELSEFYRDKNEKKRQVSSALSYPIVVLVTAIIAVYFMMWFIVPIFVDIFEQQRIELPWITEVVISISNFISNYGWVILIALLLFVFAFKYIKKQLWFKRPFDSLKLKIPVLGPYIKKVYLTQFMQAMSLLSASGIPIVNGIKMVQEMIAFYPLQKALVRIEKDLLNGNPLSASFGKHPIFDKKMIALLKVAETTNQTAFVFQKLKEQYSSELKYRSQIISTILNPIFLVIVAGIVGVILVSMYLPMFKLSSALG